MLAESRDRHNGDLGNIESKGGVTTIDIIDNRISLFGRNSILGRTVVIHEGEGANHQALIDIAIPFR